MEEILTLENACGGKVKDQFERLVPLIVSTLKDGDKGSITIKIDFKKMTDTTTMLEVKASVKPTYPAAGINSICQIGDNFRVKTEKVTPKPENLTLFKKEGVVNE
ncbi:MAG: hypothetical protein RR420_05360 [Anaerovoracaceae bacterium]